MLTATRALIAGLIVIGMALTIQGCSDDAERLARHQAAAEHFTEQGQYREAVIEYRNVVQLSPGSADAHYKLGSALLNLGTQGDINNAFGEFSKAVDADPNHLDAQLKLGLMYLLSGDDEKALEKAKLVLAGRPDDDEGMMLRAQAQSQAGNLEPARKDFMAVLKRNPNSVPAHTGLAAVLVSQKRLNEAETHFKAAVAAADPADAKPRMLLAAFYGGAGRHDDARATLEETIRVAPHTIAAYTALAQYQLRDGDVAAAKATLRTLIDTMPNHRAGYQAMATLHMQLGDFDAARQVLEDGIAASDDTDVLRVQLADLHIRQGRLEQVTAQAEALSQSETGRVMGRFFAGLVALAEGRSQDGLDAFTQVLKEQPKLPIAHFYLGRAHQLMGNAGAARDAYQAAIELDPDLVPARVELARLRLREGRLDEARTDIDTLNKVAAGLPDTLHVNGLLAMAEGKPNRAEVFFTDLVRLLPDSAEGYFQLGASRLAQKKEKSGREALEKALALDPRRDDALEMLVTADFAAGDPAAAEARARAAAAARPDDAQRQFLLGRLLVERGDVDGGIAAFQASIKADSAFFPAYGALGRLLAEEKRYDEAIAKLKEAVAQGGRAAGPHMLLGVIYEQIGKIDLAVPEYKAVLDVAPDFAPAANNLAWLYAHGAGNLDVALTLAQTAREHAPDDPGVADTLGWIYHLKGVYLKAEGLLDEALAGMPGHPVVLYHAGVNSAKLDKKDKARDYLRQALASKAPFAERPQAEAALKAL